MKDINQVIRKIIDGDVTAFKVFYEHYFDKVFHTARCIVKSDFAAEEITSDVFITLWNNRLKLSTITHVQAYVNTTIRNKAFTYLKQRKDDLYVDLDEVDFAVGIESATPFTKIKSQEAVGVISKAINRLPIKMKQTFCLIKISGYSYKEVSEMLEVTESTVNNNLTEALKRLREELTLLEEL